MPAKGGVQNRFQTLKPFLHVLGKTQKRAFGNSSGEIHDHDRKFREYDLIDRILLHARRKTGLGVVHPVPDVRDCLRFVPAELELQRDPGIAFSGRCRHSLESVNVGKLRFHRLDEQPLAVLRRYPRKRNRDENDGNLDSRFPFLWKQAIGGAARDQGDRDERQNHPSTARGPVDDARHCLTS